MFISNIKNKIPNQCLNFLIVTINYRDNKTIYKRIKNENFVCHT